MRNWDFVFLEAGINLRNSVAKTNITHDIIDANRLLENMDILLNEAIEVTKNSGNREKLYNLQKRINSEREMTSKENIFTSETKKEINQYLDELCDLFDELNYFIGINKIQAKGKEDS